jgi:hypothetical protein
VDAANVQMTGVAVLVHNCPKSGGADGEIVRGFELFHCGSGSGARVFGSRR